MPLQETYTGVKLEALFPDEARVIEVKIPASTTIAKGTVLGQTAVAIMMYDVISDASSNIFLGNVASGDTPLSVVPAYRKGSFKTSELTGLDAAGITDLGRLVQGTLADGILQVA